ncbi:MAG: LacI family DNA-binding transcriptional regulator [Phycisphaerae bacterium]|nr:LacI family DNA-binding transcriptional regulator [Phycisphaerae bacterium]
MGNATILEVAQAAGVGIGTVSRVINHLDTVKSATAEAVHKAMADLGYTPPAPEKRRGRRIGQTYPRKVAANLLLLIVGEQGLRWMLSMAPIYSAVIDGIEKGAAAHGMNMLVRQTATWNELTTVVEDNTARGAILFGSHEPLGIPPSVLQRKPAIWVMGSPENFSGDHVQPDHTKIGVLAAQYLRRRKHLRCAYLGSGEGTPRFHIGYRATGFRWAMENAGGSVDLLLNPAIVINDKEHNAPNEPLIAKLLQRLVGLKPRPSALMLEADMLAPVTYRLLQSNGVIPQKDITIVTCNNEQPYLLSLHPRPVVIDLQAQAIGKRAVDQLLWRSENPREPSVRVMVEPALVEPGVNGSGMPIGRHNQN